MTSRRNQSTSQTTKSDYTAALEQQNEQLQKKLAEAQRVNEYHANNRRDCIRCGITYIHNTENNNIEEYYTSNEFWHPINMLHEHGGLKRFIDLIADPNMTYGLTINSVHIAYTRNDRVVWDIFFDYISTEDKWRLTGLQLRDTIYSGKDLKNQKKYTWGRILRFFKDREHKYRQTY
jgi:hypothetical protein